MQTYITPLGFDTSHIVSLIVRHGIKNGDEILLLRSNGEDKRATNAVFEIKQILDKIDQTIIIKEIIVDHTQYRSMVLQFMELIIAASPPKRPSGTVHVNLSGGPREILVALVTASLALRERVLFCSGYSDVKREQMPIDLPFLQSFPDKMSISALKVIHENPGISFIDIAQQLQTSESTVSHTCARMENNHIIEIKSEGKSKFAHLSFTGEIILRKYLSTVDDYEY